MRIPNLQGGVLRMIIQPGSGPKYAFSYDGQFYQVERFDGYVWKAVSEYMRYPAEGNENLNEHRWQVNYQPGKMQLSLNGFPIGEVPTEGTNGNYTLGFSLSGADSNADVRFDDAVGSYWDEPGHSYYLSGELTIPNGKEAKRLSWIGVTPKGASLRFQLSADGSNWSPDYIVSGSPINETYDSLIYYRVYLERSDGSETPSLSEVEISCE